MAYTTINKSGDYFNTKLYTGNGTDNHGITGVGFQPDFTWIKPRNEARGHALFDAVRGATKMIISNETSAEGTYATSLKSFDSDGFNLGTSNDVNKSANTHVAWNWLANGAGSANTDGSISSTVSANTTSGFSIVKYTGTGSASTIGHGLGSAPKMIITKPISTTGVWLTWHTGISINGQIQLQSTDAVYNPGNNLYWNSTLPTSSVFSIGTSGAINVSGTEYIAYCFADVTGYSKFGSYTGNGSTDGTFIYTGFKPAFLIYKRTDTTGDWEMWDNRRSTFNPENKALFANSSNAEATASNLDFTSNGFKIRVSSGGINASGGSYIYMCFAENPFVTSTSIPCTAR